MSIQIGICDDEEEDIRILSSALYTYDATFKIFSYKNGESLLADWEEHKTCFDILFLDIYMPGINGIQIAKKIYSERNDTKIIFISSSNEHYVEAYDVFAFNYIIKPLNVEKLNRILEQALKSINNVRRQQISFSYKSIYYKIFCDDILYIESSNKIIYFHMTDKTTLQCYAKIDDICKQLPQESFIRCHQSFVVSIFHVTKMFEKHFSVDKTVISISKKYLKSSREKYCNYLFRDLNSR